MSALGTMQFDEVEPHCDWPELAPLSLRLVIMSRGRARSMTSHKLFPSADLVVPKSEFASYAERLAADGRADTRVFLIPDEVRGISAVRNFIINHFPEEAIVMIDDDISACICMVSLRCRKLNIEETLAMVSNTAYCARGAGARTRCEGIEASAGLRNCGRICCAADHLPHDLADDLDRDFS